MMTTQQVTIELPEPIFRQLVRIAAATQQSSVAPLERVACIAVRIP